MKTNEIQAEEINSKYSILLARRDELYKQQQKAIEQLQAAQVEPDTKVAARLTTQANESTAKADAELSIIDGRLDDQATGARVVIKKLEDGEDQKDKAYNAEVQQSGNDLISSDEAKRTFQLLAALRGIHNKFNRYQRFEDSEWLKSLLNPSQDEIRDAMEQLATPVEREPRDPLLDEMQDHIREFGRGEKIHGRRVTITKSPPSAENIARSAAPQRKLDAMNAISNGTATDADRALVENQPVDNPNNDDPHIQQIA